MRSEELKRESGGWRVESGVGKKETRDQRPDNIVRHPFLTRAPQQCASSESSHLYRVELALGTLELILDWGLDFLGNKGKIIVRYS